METSLDVPDIVKKVELKKCVSLRRFRYPKKNSNQRPRNRIMMCGIANDIIKNIKKCTILSWEYTSCCSSHCSHLKPTHKRYVILFKFRGQPDVELYFVQNLITGEVIMRPNNDIPGLHKYKRSLLGTISSTNSLTIDEIKILGGHYMYYLKSII